MNTEKNKNKNTTLAYSNSNSYRIVSHHRVYSSFSSRLSYFLPSVEHPTVARCCTLAAVSPRIAESNETRQRAIPSRLRESHLPGNLAIHTNRAYAETFVQCATLELRRARKACWRDRAVVARSSAGRSLSSSR